MCGNRMYVMDADCQKRQSFLYLFILFGRCRIRKASPMGLQIKNVYIREENMEQAQQQEIKRKIKENPEMTEGEKGRELKRLSEPYKKMSDEELLQLVRDFVRECGREPTRKDVLYDRELKYRFGPWTRMLEKAGTRPVAEHYLERKKRRREKRERHKEYRRQLREQQAAEAARLEEAARIE